MSIRRPTVVIAGWLGCQPSKLRRYQELYHQRGYPTVLRIATPLMVVTSVTPSSSSSSSSSFLQPPRNWPLAPNSSNSSSNHDASLHSMEDLAWDVLQHLHHKGSYQFLMHSFSNGGCFLYEKIRRILQHYQTLPTPPSSPSSSSSTCDTTAPTAILRQFHMVAGVFDSCPALDLSKIDQALSHCTEEERHELYRQHPHFRSELDQHLAHRQKEYRSFLQTQDDPLPQLFIYSRDDPLVPYQTLDELVEARRRHSHSRSYDATNPPPPTTAGPIPSNRVQTLVLDQSSHCAHLLHHPQAYTEALYTFLHQTVECVETPEAKL